MAATQNMLMYHCQKCGKVVEQAPGMPAPNCCGQPMAIGAVDTPSEKRRAGNDQTGPRAR